MNKISNLTFIVIIAIFFNACGEENEVNSIELEPKTEAVQINRQAVTFPELPTTNSPMSTVDIETH